MISSNSRAVLSFYSYKKSYYRFDVARFILTGRSDPSKFFVIVYKNKTPVSCFSGLQKLPFSVMQGGEGARDLTRQAG